MQSSATAFYCRIVRHLRRRHLQLYQHYVRLKGSPYGIRIGKGTMIYPGASLRNDGSGSIVIGSQCEVLQWACLWTYGGSIEIGDHTSINPFCILYGHGGLRIGSRVKIATQTVFIPANHNFSDPKKPFMDQGLTCRGIEVGDDVWFGTGVRVLDGVKIVSGCIVGAGSVVTRSLEMPGVYAGVPARLIRPR
jgi:acetyltransferase-like isoleucine patch superfamily enzyme